MINLLPPEEKQRLFLKKEEKLTMLTGVIVLVFLVCLTLILLSIKFYILADADYQKNILAQNEREEQISNSANLDGTIQKYNVILAQLDSFYKKEIYFNQALNIVTGVPTPKGLYLTNFSLDRNAQGLVQVSVSGISDTRDNLLIFQKNINQDQEIKNPYFSPESWINQKNVDFSLTFEIDQNEKQ